ncbi:GNAT family N-acetyltransferase [Cryobacterium sp. PAMC25264]|uniref:GNAT family N-acetyltransferase n=1 Tax=Cryobacterium sp. PAMC25264 TaxID=2861288 RepID=UPI001C630A30|nr:GNAT family N-acetyltransferase [Cryobacterium sp. PAMC25264]QYF73483.1 N-acetyltransferase [Cryobacterium sp. PAMC25264]
MTTDELTTDGSGARVEHEPEVSRYTLWQDGEPVGLADYRIEGEELRFTHTEVDPARRDHGLASILVEGALDDVRTRTDFTVVAECPFVAEWIDSHAEYQDLLSRGR